VPTSKDFIDVVMARTQRQTPTVVHRGYAITRIRAFYMRKVKFTQTSWNEKLSRILEGGAGAPAPCTSMPSPPASEHSCGSLSQLPAVITVAAVGSLRPWLKRQPPPLWAAVVTLSS